MPAELTIQIFSFEDKLTNRALQLPLLICIEDYCRLAGLSMRTVDTSAGTILQATCTRPEETVYVRYLTDDRVLLKHQSGGQRLRVFEVDLLESRLLYTRIAG